MNKRCWKKEKKNTSKKKKKNERKKKKEKKRKIFFYSKTIKERNLKRTNLGKSIFLNILIEWIEKMKKKKKRIERYNELWNKKKKWFLKWKREKKYKWKGENKRKNRDERYLSRLTMRVTDFSSSCLGKVNYFWEGCFGAQLLVSSPSTIVVCQW